MTSLLTPHIKNFKRQINRGEIVTKNDIIAFFGRLYHLAYRQADTELPVEISAVMCEIEWEEFDGALHILVDLYPEAFND